MVRFLDSDLEAGSVLLTIQVELLEAIRTDDHGPFGAADVAAMSARHLARCTGLAYGLRLCLRRRGA